MADKEIDNAERYTSWKCTKVLYPSSNTFKAFYFMDARGGIRRDDDTFPYRFCIAYQSVLICFDLESRCIYYKDVKANDENDWIECEKKLPVIGLQCIVEGRSNSSIQANGT